MTRIIAAAALALAFFTSAAASAQRTLSVTDYDRVIVEGPFEVTLVTGAPSAAMIEGSQAAADKVSIRVEGRLLRVRANRSAWGGYPGDKTGPVAIRLKTRILREASVLGAGSLTVDKAAGLRVEFSVIGSGRLDVGKVEADNLVLGLAGAGRLQIAGRAKELKAAVQGSGDFDASGLKALEAVINTETSGRVTVGVERSAKVVAAGTGVVTILGKPECRVTAKGSVVVRCGD